MDKAGDSNKRKTVLSSRTSQFPGRDEFKGFNKWHDGGRHHKHQGRGGANQVTKGDKKVPGKIFGNGGEEQRSWPLETDRIPSP